MKIYNTLKIIFALLPFAFTSIHAAYTSSANADTLFQEACEYYEYYEERLDNPRVLSLLELKLKRVIECEVASQETLSQCAKLLLSLGCKASYDLALNRIHLPTYSEFCYNEAFRIHTINAQNHTLHTLTTIDLLLTRIKDDAKASATDVYNAASLACLLDFITLYSQLANILFYRKDFDPKIYKRFVQKTRLIKEQREEAKLTHL